MAMSKQRRKPVKAKASQQAQARRPSLRTLWQQHSVNLGTADAVYAALREAIISGVLKPGDKLGEEYLASEFNVSRCARRWPG